MLQYACSIGDADALQYMLEQRKADANFQTQVQYAVLLLRCPIDQSNPSE